MGTVSIYTFLPTFEIRKLFDKKGKYTLSHYIQRYLKLCNTSTQLVDETPIPLIYYLRNTTVDYPKGGAVTVVSCTVTVICDVIVESELILDTSDSFAFSY